MDQGQADITVTPELLSAQTFRQKFVDLKAGLKYTFRVSQTLRGCLWSVQFSQNLGMNVSNDYDISFRVLKWSFTLRRCF